MRELIRHIALALVDNREAVEVREVEGDDGLVLELHVAASDLGKVIGRQGRTARAMRALLRAARPDMGKRLSLEIME
ncbi:MAG: KH domain-containing protein [Thermodesulfobacteriota bacterium]